MLTRRTFVTTSLASGFALAVRPVSAETVTTDPAGLVAGEVKIGPMPAYRAMPEARGPFPVVLVVQEIFGVHEHIKDVCRRFAKAGYLAVAPELYARQGDVAKMGDTGEILKLVARVPDEQVFADLDAAVAWARGTGKADGGKVAVSGFCWGGRIVWLYAARGTAKAGAAFYGRLSHAVNAFTTKTPLDVAARLRAPVLGLYGGKDAGIPLSHVALMRKELGPSKSEIVVYPGAGHGFHADYRPSYDKAAAEDAWAKTLAWFAKRL